MLIGSHRRHRLAVSATLLVGLVGALLGCTGFPVAAAAAGTVAQVSAVAAEERAPAAEQPGPVGPPGCGRSADDDSGAHPALPPRGGPWYELPALHQGGGSPGSALWAHPVLDRSSLPAQPAPAPPSPVGLSVLRV